MSFGQKNDCNNDTTSLRNPLSLNIPLPYPNPTKEIVYLPKGYSYQIFDMAGRLITEYSDGGKHTVANFTSGIYIVNYINDNKIIFRGKIIRE